MSAHSCRGPVVGVIPTKEYDKDARLRATSLTHLGDGVGTIAQGDRVTQLCAVCHSPAEALAGSSAWPVCSSFAEWPRGMRVILCARLRRMRAKTPAASVSDTSARADAHRAGGV